MARHIDQYILSTIFGECALFTKIDEFKWSNMEYEGIVYRWYSKGTQLKAFMRFS